MRIFAIVLIEEIAQRNLAKNWNPTIELAIDEQKQIIKQCLRNNVQDKELFQILYDASPIPALRSNASKLSSLCSTHEMKDAMKLAFDVRKPTTASVFSPIANSEGLRILRKN